MKIKFHAIAIALTAMLVATSCATKNNSDRDDDSTDEKEAVEQNDDADAEDEIAEDEIAEDCVIEVNNADKFINYIDEQGYSTPLVLEFNATWCGPCQAFKPVYHQVANNYGDQIKFFSIDIDNNDAVAEKYGIRAIPAMVVILPDGAVYYPSIDGSTTADELEAILQKYI